MGNAAHSATSASISSVHPHVHGERFESPLQIIVQIGSSPRTWGTRRAVRLEYYEGRFIPTYMGNAIAVVFAMAIKAVHPHVHGERLIFFKQSVAFSGSSPRTWGTRGPRPGGLTFPRFIPTYMGNAEWHQNHRYIKPVHPHVHGERVKPAGILTIDTGSSPRTWGTLVYSLIPFLSMRFIPTYMGNADCAVRAHVPEWVHPHVHGERCGIARPGPGVYGSSPRTWGTRCTGSSARSTIRFIPTYMGNANLTGFSNL